MKKIIKMPGIPFTLPDGRILKFVEVDITALDDPCYGCCLSNENCTVRERKIRWNIWNLYRM